VVTCVDLTKLDETWLGRIIDEAFVAGIENTGIDPALRTSPSQAQSPPITLPGFPAHGGRNQALPSSI
jgi:hypothetical protein